jgi:hypothetical protein
MQLIEKAGKRATKAKSLADSIVVECNGITAVFPEKPVWQGLADLIQLSNQCNILQQL